MSKINIFNYEGYYLELIEGTISIENKALLLDFLSKNPQLVEPEFDFVIPKLDVDATPKFKESLKIHSESEIISEFNVEWFVWAKMEGVLSSSASVRLKKYLDDHPALYRLVVDFYETTLPQEKFIFQNKRSLKKGKKVAIWPIISTAVAVVLGVLLVGNLFYVKQNQEKPAVSKIKLKEPKQKTEEKSSIKQEDLLVRSISSNEINATIAVASPKLIQDKKETKEETTRRKAVNSKVDKSKESEEVEENSFIQESILAENTSKENKEIDSDPLISTNDNSEKLTEKEQNASKATSEESSTVVSSPESSYNRRGFRFGIGKFGIRRK